MNKKRRTHQDIRKFWGVSLRTVAHWVTKGYPIHDDRSLAKALLANPATSERLQARALELSGGTRPVKSAEPPVDIQRVHRSLAEELVEIDEWITISQSEMKAAKANGHAAEFNRWNKIRREFSDQKVKNLLAQAKLGIDSGELINRAEVERLFGAFAGRAAVSIARLCDEMSIRLVGMRDAGEAHQVLQDPLWGAMYVKPFQAAIDNKTFFTLPQWTANALVKAFSDLMSDATINELGLK